MRYLIVTAEKEVFTLNELTDDVLDRAESDLLTIVDTEDEVYFDHGEWVDYYEYD